MKHRKFVKQLMAVGIQRNTAESMAVWVQGSMHGYKEHLPAYLSRHKIPLRVDRGEFQTTYLGRWVGLDLAQGPDFTAGGGGA